MARKRMVLLLGEIGLLLLLSTIQLSAATHYIVAGGTGAQTGADWSNALGGIPSTPVRGDTYYVATGDYSYTAITTPASGTSAITFTKATATDHGTSTGWQSSYGTGQAVWSNAGICWNIQAPYLTFNGNSWTGPLANTNTTQYGFKLSSSYVGATPYGAVSVFYGYTAANITLNGVEIQSNGQDTDGNHHGLGIYVNGNGTCNNWTIQNCYLHDDAGWLQITGDGWTCDHTYFESAGSSYAGDHCAGLLYKGANFTVRYCVLDSMVGTENTTYIEPNYGSGTYTLNTDIYGNIFVANHAGEMTTQWANYSGTRSGSVVYNNVRFHQNTSYGLHGPYGVNVNSGSSGSSAINNVWVNCTNAYSYPFTGVNSAAKNYPVDSVKSPSFTSASTGDFTLTDQTDTGLDLGSPYNTDPVGNTRTVGAASLGAFQYTGGVAPAGDLKLSASAYSTTETSGNVVVTVQRENGSSGALSATLATSDGTATAGHDYMSTTATVSFADGVTTAQTVSIPILNSGDTATTNRTFTVTLTGSEIGSPPSATVTIQMTPPAPVIPLVTFPTFNAADGLVTLPCVVTNTSKVWNPENSQGGYGGLIQFRVVIPSSGLYTMNSEVSATDPASNSWWVDWNSDPRNDDTRAFDITNISPALVSTPVRWRGTGTFDNPLGKSQWSLSAGTNTLWIGGREPGIMGQITISQVTPPPPPPYALLHFSASAVTVTNIDQSVTLTVSRDVSQTNTTTVDFATSDGTAKAGTNYTSSSGTLSFAPGQTSQSITVPIKYQAGLTNFVQFTASLSNPSFDGQLVDPLTATVTIAPGLGSAPNTPTNSLPADAASAVSLTPTLKISGYSSPDASAQTGLGIHVFQGGQLAWDWSGTETTSLSIPAGVLAYSTAYTWQARTKNVNGWSGWSPLTSFTTTNAPGLVQTLKFNGPVTIQIFRNP